MKWGYACLLIIAILVVAELAWRHFEPKFDPDRRHHRHYDL